MQITNRWTGEVIFDVGDEKCKLSTAVLRAIGKGISLKDASIRCLRLPRTDLRGADFKGADMRGSNLCGANLQDADLRGTDLRGSDLRGIQFGGSMGLSAWCLDPLLLLYDQPGDIRAYKLVNEKGKDPFGNDKEKYEIGGEYRCDNANADSRVEWGTGIRLATADWCASFWEPGRRILIAEFRAGDIAAIPLATIGQFRVHKCKIVDEKDLKRMGLLRDEG
jgi:hypothetical protein